MRYPAAHKAETRAKILAAAGTLFRRDGFHAAGVDKVMQEAGLTAGGFYAHFPSKEALLAEALVHAARAAGEMREGGLENSCGAEWLEGVIGRYLSPEHRAHPEAGCPLASLAPEIGRAGAAPRQAFEAVLRQQIKRVQSQLAASGGQVDDRHALAVLALCVGGLVLARGVLDESFADQILTACREMAIGSLRSVADGTGCEGGVPASSARGRSSGQPSAEGQCP
jgi:TetR/AcrR family transcriptional repressor of nem operon